MARFRGVRWRIAIPAAVVVAASLAFAATPPRPTVLALRDEGLAIGSGGALVVVPAGANTEVYPGTSVLTSADLTDPELREVIATEQAWLGAGHVPGAGTRYADMAERALLDLRLLKAGNGAVMGAPVTAWKHVWPRDASFAAAAFAVTGHPDDALQVFGFLADVAPEDGRWEARYRRDGSGDTPDNRPKQFDGAGWVPWAVWMAAEVSTDPTWVDELIATTEDAVVASADAIAELVGDDGLAPPSSDYWERRENHVTLGIVAPLSAGLRAAIDLAPRLGVDPTAWRSASDRLDTAIEREFAPHGYPRTVPDGGLDAAVSILVPPFAPASDGVAEAVATTEKALRVPNGGHRPGEVWKKDVDVAWTPETGMLALASAGLGHEDDALRLLDFLDGHRTALGALPEKVDSKGDPASVAPLGWTGSLVLLTLAELEGGLPVVPG